MCFFFGLAIKEVTEAEQSAAERRMSEPVVVGVPTSQALLPGGSLSPLRRATNPLMATLGGVLGPVATYAGTQERQK